jgi:cytochrome c-type biogenesis protein
MAGVDFPLALSRGMIAAFNPCGFAMLPAYVSYFVGTNAAGTVDRTVARLRRAALVGLVTTAGFVAVFSAVGYIVSDISAEVLRVAPWATLAIGLALAVLGAAMLAGYEPRFSLPKVGRARRGTGLVAMFCYGVSYALVSLSCSLSLFLGNISSTVNTTLLRSTLAFVAYGLGMGFVMVVVSLAVALAQQPFISWMRRALPYIGRVSGLLLTASGLYVAYYGYYEWRVLRNDRVAAGPVEWVTRWSANVSSRLAAVSSTTLLLGLVVGVAVLVPMFVLRDSRVRARGK